MIFLTVGTHEQPFNRVVERLDMLKKNQVIKDDVFIQIGFSTYEPEHCKWQKFVNYSKMQELFIESDIIITHGGPSSFMPLIQMGKVPIVVPRNQKFNEHINNHQIDFVQKIYGYYKNIIPVYDISQLEYVVINYKQICRSINNETVSNNKNFTDELEDIIKKLC